MLQQKETENTMALTCEQTNYNMSPHLLPLNVVFSLKSLPNQLRCPKDAQIQMWILYESGVKEQSDRSTRSVNLPVIITHNTDSLKSVSIHSTTGVRMFTHALQGPLGLFARLHQSHATGSRDIKNSYMINNNISFLYYNI